MTTLVPTANYRLCRKIYPSEKHKIQISDLILQRLYMSDKGNMVWQNVEEHIEIVEEKND